MTTLDSKIINLSKSGTLVLSESNGIVCSVERSGDGKTLRFVRTLADGSWTVFHSCKF